MPDWNSEQYLKFKAQRTQPAIDLVNMIKSNPREVIDVGCGPANSTAVLVERFPAAHITGADNSADMLARAAQSCPKADFICLDAGGDLSEHYDKYDLVFSNACIQWIACHNELLPRLFKMLKEGGTLAVQIPVNYDEPIHQIIGRLVKSPRWAEKFTQPRIFYTLTQGEYFDILSALTNSFEMKQITYLHRMPSAESIIEWYKGTGLRPYLSVLSEDDAALFEREVFEEVKKEYLPQQNGEIIFRFPRLLFTAVRERK